MSASLRRPRLLLGALALTATLALTLSGCVTAFLPEPGRSATAPLNENVAENLKPFYGQDVEWKKCNSGMECATITSPMDWANPERDTLTLDLIRTHADSGSARLGSLLVNPGGPGASGYDFVADSVTFATDDRLRKSYDIVGFDPRGVGRSTPVKCLDDAAMDNYLYGAGSTAERGSAEWIAEAAAEASSFGAACLKQTGPALEFINTVNSARDMDLIRSLVGDPKLNFLGYSYGTFLGATYAELYPQNVGRLVLDGAIDPSVSNAEVSKIQAVGFENALRAYLEDCLTGTRCPFTGSVDEAMTTVTSLLDSTAASPLRVSDGRILDANTLMTAIIFPLYSAESWPALSQMFASVLGGDPGIAMQFADQYNGRDSSGRYTENSTEAFTAYNCRDYTYNADPESMAAEARAIEEAAPVLGKYMTYGDIGCANWPFPDGAERTKIHAAGAPDILVLGTTNDPATPYEWAVSLADQLESGHLVTYQGEGHTAYNKGSACINNTVDDFLINGTVPERDPQCRL
ncbi:alpha/beta hydrolase [Mycetocola spongiae]|uniref:alpha/beta hydrolase n=1 Tax=Mycetocola spongiae TaxID=2859226 RepID=UPI001CF1384B|nr:alpha/beta hydrolase [Mycetocola spongiae]UCR87845.1 alpha/beta hydrolase [Mycetocola spongiae]